VESTSVGNDNVVPLVTGDPTSEQRSAAAMVSIAKYIDGEVLWSVSKRIKYLSCTTYKVNPAALTVVDTASEITEVPLRA
jgi:predicted nucleic acid-binding protein